MNTLVSAANLISLWIVVLINLLLTIGLIRRLTQLSKVASGFDEEDVGLEKGEQAPDFIAETLDGQVVGLADFTRKAISLVFVSPTCSPCIRKLSKLNALRPQAEQAGVELLLVSTDGDRDKMTALAKERNLTLPILFAPMDNNSFAEDYKALATPSFCSLSSEGRVNEAGAFGAKWEKVFVNSWAA